MAFNQASFFLFPPGYRPGVEVDESARTASGKPLEIVSPVAEDSTADKILTADVSRWFADRGFSEKERYGAIRILQRNPITTPVGTLGEIELYLPLEEEAIEVLYLRFLLTKNTPASIPGWQDLVAELGHDFGLRLMDDDHQLLPGIDFLSVLAGNENFRAFQDNFGWKIGPGS